MAKFSRNFIAGRMNKVVDQRLLPEGEYVDAMNVRMGDTEKSEIGVIENTKGNIPLTSLMGPDGIQLSVDARCIGAVEDSANETIYWFVHDKSFIDAPTGVCDLIVSFNILTNILTYHVISVDDGSGLKSTLNFNEKYLITGVNIIGNLLYFTDNYNPPRYINTRRNYSNPVGLIDSISAEQLLVIKKPPIQSPTVVPIVTNGQQNYMDTRFISFAYRYRYIDGEYSATSQWSQIAFYPKPFTFSINSMLNEGMTNFCNAAVITYNTGSSLVVGIDLLFKQSANNIIKVIEKLDKANLGLPDNQLTTYTFSNSKIFTILSESELLRLYDNVPRYAQAQTIMGNRLMYGNYIEGYDLIDKNGNPLKLEYSTNLISESIGSSIIPDTQISGIYTINSFFPISVPLAKTFIDLTGIPLVAGSSITVNMTLRHASFSGQTPFPTETTDAVGVVFTFYLSQDYASVYEMATSPEFQAAVGTSLPSGNIKPVYSSIPGVQTSCSGTTFTDQVNCILPNNLNSFQKVASGINTEGEAIKIWTSPISQSIGFQMPAMKYVSPVPPTPATQTVFEYYSITYTSASFQKVANPGSLHSNRGYEIGIVYMDDFNRSSTALVSPNNTQYVPCGFSPKRNSIQVEIPPQQIAPYWATRYKFVIKPDAEFYETIFCDLFFTDPETNEVWFFLEGENTRKVETGDRLIVKADTSGPVLTCTYATVLEKVSKSSGFITPTEGVNALAGVYMKINPNNFNAVLNPLALIAPGLKQICTSGVYPVKLSYPMNILGTDPAHPTWTYIDYSVPAGSRIQFKWDWNREGGDACASLGYSFDRTFVASRDYDNMEDWFNGDNIAGTLSSGHSKDGTTHLQYIPTNGILNVYDYYILYIQFYRNPTTNELVLQYSSGYGCFNFINRNPYCMSFTNTVFRALNTIVFETQPSDASPDVFFENNLSFAIDSYGNHSGNVQTQDIANGVPAIVDTEFFNCFTFGNGVESYKIRDSIIGKYFTLGERVTTVSAQDYKESRRFADITYSGVFNAETNVNKLNEFNLGLLNYKNLETSFGSIYIMDGRETDVLVLQEDKISYVLAGKNLLSDSAAGGAITSVPEVLGTQIARVEKYGISFNPESYVQWGFNRFFTDVKRGAVINIKGDSMQQDQLAVISDANMRTWFRDEFNKSFNTQKLGGYDPYMNEYVLCTNDMPIPVDAQCIECGVSQTFNLSSSDLQDVLYEYCVDLGPLVGDVTIHWNVLSISDGHFNIQIKYDGTTYSTPTTTTSGSYTFPKSNILAETAVIKIAYTCTSLVLDVLIDCPFPEVLNIVEVVLTNNIEASDSSHIQYRYTNGSFIGPLISSAVIFAGSPSAPVISRYNISTGNVGSGAFPPQGSIMTLISNSISPDNFVFNPLNDNFRYLRSNILYSTTEIDDLIAASSLATPNIGSGSVWQSEFTVPNSTFGNYLYLIWDYRDALPLNLCYGVSFDENPPEEVCCNCRNCITDCVTVTVRNLSDTNTAEIFFPDGCSLCSPCVECEPGGFSIELTPSEVVSGISVNNSALQNGVNYDVISGSAYVEVTDCGCVNDCTETCSQWYYINQSDSVARVSYISCSNCVITETVDIPPQTVMKLDVCKGITPHVIIGSASGLVLTKYCGTCPIDTTYCLNWEIYDITGPTTLQFTDCGSDTIATIELIGGESSFTVCVDYPSIPTLTNTSNAKLRIFPDGCNCYAP